MNKSIVSTVFVCALTLVPAVASAGCRNGSCGCGGGKHHAPSVIQKKSTPKTVTESKTCQCKGQCQCGEKECQCKKKKCQCQSGQCQCQSNA